MPRLNGLTSITIDVPDVDAAAAFFGYHVGLDRTGGDGERIYLRAGLEHHCIQLRQRRELERAEVSAIAYSVAGRERFEALRTRAAAAGCDPFPTEPGRRAHATDAFSLRDPDGRTIELVLEPYVFAACPVSGYRPAGMVHPFLLTPNYAAAVAFYQDVLGFTPSDYVEDKLVFLRCDDLWHHSVALLQAGSAGIGHICFLMESFDDVMRGRARADFRKVPIPVDLVKHSGSESIAVYIQDDAHGPRIELCDSHRRFTPDEDAHHVPRRMADDPRNTMDLWRADAEHDWRPPSDR